MRPPARGFAAGLAVPPVLAAPTVLAGLAVLTVLAAVSLGSGEWGCDDT